MLIPFDQVPSWLLWSAVGFSVATVMLAIRLVGKRYLWLCFAVPLFAGLLLFVRMGPDRKFAHGIVLYCDVVLSFAIGLLWQIRRLRAAYAENPKRELGKLMTERQQLQFCAVVVLSMTVLYVAVAVLCGGFIS